MIYKIIAKVTTPASAFQQTLTQFNNYESAENFILKYAQVLKKQNNQIKVNNSKITIIRDQITKEITIQPKK